MVPVAKIRAPYECTIFFPPRYTSDVEWGRGRALRWHLLVCFPRLHTSGPLNVCQTRSLLKVEVQVKSIGLFHRVTENVFQSAICVVS